MMSVYLHDYYRKKRRCFKIGFRVYCDRCDKELDPKGHRAALLMGQEHLLDLCPTCCYDVADYVKEELAKTQEPSFLSDVKPTKGSKK